MPYHNILYKQSSMSKQPHTSYVSSLQAQDAVLARLEKQTQVEDSLSLKKIGARRASEKA